MPYCEECGQEHHTDAQFCPRCGEVVGGVGDSDGSAGEGASERSAAPAEHPEAAVEDTGRRSYLKMAGGAVALLVGGSYAAQMLRTPDHSAVGRDAWENQERTAVRNGSGIKGTVTLEPGEFTAYSFETWGNAGLIAAVNEVEQGVIDIWTVVEQDIGRYRGGEEVAFVADVSESGIAESTLLASPVSDGTYWLVVDNTPVYGSEPEETAVASVGLGAGAL